MSDTVSCMSTAKDRRSRAIEIAKVEHARNTSQKRTHPRRAKGGSKRPPIMGRLRGQRLLTPDMRVRYVEGVAERSVDRAAWARLIAELINTEAGGNTTRFAQLVGVTYKTVRRWILQQTEVSEDSIRQVADALHITPAKLLVGVGLYRPDELAAPAAPEPVADDPALQAILEADVPPRVKQRMIQRLQQLRQADQQRYVDEVRFWLDQTRGA